ncbi:MAG: hypothetical protein H0Z18_10920 [Thermococcus sp.]|uniref:hypothetical protein n=1 Tax=Thermococcus sp. TaxID=35749 RepID=UPI001E0D8625|nr:hypothetical protein [Thermococcus sp.]MBO8175758.1 hypothetical protein [Thermococcus sp.]
MLATAGAASAATLDLPKWVIVPEDSSFSDVTLFCGLDAMDTTNNVTPCYREGSVLNAVIYFNETGYPKLATGKILNAFEFDGSTEYVETVLLNSTKIADGFGMFLHFNAKGTGTIVAQQVYNSDDPAQTLLRLRVISSEGTYYIRFEGLGDGNSWSSNRVILISQISLNKDYTVIVNFDGQTVTLELYDENNNLLDTQTATVSWTIATSYTKNWPFSIGAVKSTWPSPNDVYRDFFNGTIDEVRFYYEPLSDDAKKLLLYAGRKKLSEQAQFKQLFSPMVDLTKERATFYAGLEVSTSDPNGYVPVPESAVNMSITSAEKLKSDYTGYDFYYQGHYWYRADKIQFNLPIQFETLREKNSFAKEILLDDDSKTFIYEKEFRVTNPTATKINILYTVDPTALGFSVLQYPQFELDGVPMAEWRPSNSTSLYLIRTDSLEPGEISTHWMKSIWTITKEELEFPAKIDDFRSITDWSVAQRLAENAVEGKTDTYVKVIKIDSNADVSNVTILVPLKDVEDKNDVIEAVALTGSRETLQVEELEDGKIVIKVPGDAFISGHAEIKVLYNKEGKSGIFAIISKILAKVKELLRKLGLGGLVFWPVYG